jgi:tetratricopeptide (TPR) repeat protein
MFAPHATPLPDRGNKGATLSPNAHQLPHRNTAAPRTSGLSFSNWFEETLLLLEDLQWAVESLDVLREINTSISDLKLLIVGNYRDDERPDLPAELPTMRVIKLERWSSDAIEALTVSMLGEVGRQYDAVDLLQRESEGNALFVVEVVRALAEEAGRLSDRGSMALPKQVFAGVLYQGNLRGALANAEKVEQLAASPQTSAQEAADTRPEQAYALFLQGWSYLSLGELDKALTFGERALTLNRTLHKQDQMAQSMNLLGTVYLMLGEYAQAEPHLDQAFTLFKALGERESAAALMNNLGLIAEKRGDYRLALERYQSALAQMREIKNRDAERIYLSNIGGAKIGLGLFAEAERDLQEVVYMAGADGFGQLSETYRFLAEAYIGQDKLFLAEDTALKALGLGRKVGSAEYLAAAWRLLGQVASRVGGAVNVPDADTPDGAPETPQHPRR